MKKAMTSKFKYLLIASMLSLSIGVYAQGYTPLADLSGTNLQTGKTIDIATFIPALVKLAIGIAGGLAIIYIIIGGIQYMSTDAWTGKKDGIKTINNAVVGLLLTIAAYSILYTVNPRLVEFTLKIEGLDVGKPINSGEGENVKTAAALGCANCEFIDSGFYDVNPYACTNTPCYLNEDLLERLGDLRKDLKSDEPEDDVAWQITKAFPVEGSADPCYKPEPGADKKQVGRCFEIALTAPNTPRIIRLVTELQAKYLVNFKSYFVCPADRAATIRNAISDVTIKNKISCIPNSTEKAIIKWEAN